MNDEMKSVGEFKKELDKVGHGFCLAKWTQVTIHLQLGQTHSCHHPATHKIPVSELIRNPSALHNTKFKKQRRKEMLEGKRPTECDYCWNVEDNSNEFSDRIWKSHEPWSKPYLEEIKELGWRGDYNPKYVEVAFSNACNFKCSYCGPSFSSSWVQEIKKHGAYPTSDKFNNLEWLEENKMMPYQANEHNPYVEAFWKWWPDLYKDLHTFRMTGGEPLMHKDVWKILDYIIEHPEPNRELRLGINSNLGVPDELIDKFIEKLKIIEDNNLVKEIIIFTSADTAGEHANYIRNGLDYIKFKSNILKIFTSCKRVSMIIMSTFNILSIPRYKELLDFVYDCKKKFNSEHRYWNPGLMIDSSYLRFPSHQAVNILPEKYIDQVKELADYADGLRIVDKDPNAEWRAHHMGFTDIEISKIRRIADWMSSPHDEVRIRESRKNFYRFFKAHDERRGTDFKETFPELVEFYEECKKLAE